MWTILLYNIDNVKDKVIQIFSMFLSNVLTDGWMDGLIDCLIDRTRKWKGGEQEEYRPGTARPGPAG